MPASADTYWFAPCHPRGVPVVAAKPIRVHYLITNRTVKSARETLSTFFRSRYHELHNDDGCPGPNTIANDDEFDQILEFLRDCLFPQLRGDSAMLGELRPRHVIVSESCFDAAKSLLDTLPKKLRCWPPRLSPKCWVLLRIFPTVDSGAVTTPASQFIPIADDKLSDALVEGGSRL